MPPTGCFIPVICSESEALPLRSLSHMSLGTTILQAASFYGKITSSLLNMINVMKPLWFH